VALARRPYRRPQRRPAQPFGALDHDQGRIEAISWWGSRRPGLPYRAEGSTAGWRTAASRRWRGLGANRSRSWIREGLREVGVHQRRAGWGGAGAEGGGSGGSRGSGEVEVLKNLGGDVLLRTHATTRRLPPHRSQVRTSVAKVFLRSVAPGTRRL